MLGAGSALALVIAAPLSAQQPTSQQADSACRSLGKSAEECKTQTQSGVVDSTGKSTLGAGVGKTSPAANQPVTAKGDTLRKAADDMKKTADDAQKAKEDMKQP